MSRQPPGTPPQPPPQGSYTPRSRDPYREQRMWAMWCHLSALAGFIIPFGNIFGPLIVWQTKRQEFPLVDEHGKESLNFQISVTIYFVAAILFTIIFAIVLVGLLGIPVIIGLGIFSLVSIIMASIRANEGRPWRYALTIRFFN